MLCAPVTYETDARSVRQRADQVMVEAAADAGGHPVGQVRDLAALFRDRIIRVVGAVRPRRRVAVPRLVRAPAGLEQEPARDRRRPGGLLDARRLVERPARRFRRRRRACRRPSCSTLLYCSDQ